jgi:mannonate dehydratase
MTVASEVLMTQTMRWFGPSDPVSLSDIRQAGCVGVVTALHEVPNGEIWGVDQITQRRALIEAAGMSWTVVESLPVHEAIKTQSAGFERYLENYNASLRNLAECGLKVITYNFMPLLDWTRSNLSLPMPDGALALGFDATEVAAFDLFILARPGAERDYTEQEVSQAERRYWALSAEERHTLERNILAGLPGSEESFTAPDLLTAIRTYSQVDAQRLRDNLAHFLASVCPTAEQCGLRLAIHPDDPPFPLFGLPRVVSTEADVQELFNRVTSPSNGLCLCTGSFGVRPDNDVPGMVERLGPRIYFLHLRNISRTGGGNFHESTHLGGDVDMFRVVDAVHRLSIAEKRSIPMRPDHGHQMLDDLNKQTNPGYSAIGRLRGLAELRGLELGIARAAEVARG